MLVIKKQSDDEYFESLDIPRNMRSITSYCATLAHKVNHSFHPNCRFGDYCHPLYGDIRCIVTVKPVEKGEELLVHYNYYLDDCPGWYRELWDNLV